MIVLDRGGEYKITVGNNDPNGAGAGAYRFKLWPVPPPDVFEIGLDQQISRDVPGEGAGYIDLMLAGGGLIRLEVEAIEASLRDISEHWPARARPAHSLEEN